MRKEYDAKLAALKAANSDSISAVSTGAAGDVTNKVTGCYINLLSLVLLADP